MKKLFNTFYRFLVLLLEKRIEGNNIKIIKKRLKSMERQVRVSSEEGSLSTWVQIFFIGTHKGRLEFLLLKNGVFKKEKNREFVKMLGDFYRDKDDLIFVEKISRKTPQANEIFLKINEFMTEQPLNYYLSNGYMKNSDKREAVEYVMKNFLKKKYVELEKLIEFDHEDE